MRPENECTVRARGHASWRVRTVKALSGRLAEIFAEKQRQVAAAKASLPEAEIRERAEHVALARGFCAALRSARHPVACIAEVKRASPSEGLIRESFDPVAMAQSYERAGASCLSVLTDETFFQGSAAHLMKCREATGLPVLRKDFILDPYQVYEARAWGADALLLIVAALEPAELSELHALATSLHLDVLVEVHTEYELADALAIGAQMIGINNRDLATFQTDLGVCERLVPMVGDEATTVAESGIGSREDVERMRAAGADAVLIGTALCASEDVGSKLREVMGW